MVAAHDNPGWTPDIARMLTDELRKTNALQRELLDVLRDLRDVAADLRDELRARRLGAT